MTNIKRPNMKCMHCGYKWYSARYQKTKELDKFCSKCYKKEVIQISTNRVVIKSIKLKEGIQKEIKNTKKYCKTNNITFEDVKEHYGFQVKVVMDIILFAITIMILTYALYVTFVI